MAKQDAFTAEEWTQLRLAPALIASGMSAADAHGIFSAVKEAAYGAGAMVDAYKAAPGLELFQALAADRSMPATPEMKSMTGGEGTVEQQLQNLKNSVLSQAKKAVAIVAAKASPAELEAYKKMLVAVAQKAAEASKEGGFLGFGGVRVSDKEQAFLNEVQKAVGVA